MSDIAQSLLEEKDAEIEQLTQQLRAAGAAPGPMETLDGSHEKSLGEELLEGVEDLDEKDLENLGIAQSELGSTHHLVTKLKNRQEELEKLQEAFQRIGSTNEELSEALIAKDAEIETLKVQLAANQEEITNVNYFHTQLQEDYDKVQEMLNTKAQETDTLTKQMDEVELIINSQTDELTKAKIGLKEKDNVIDEKEEELYVLKEQVEQMTEAEAAFAAKEREFVKLQEERSDLLGKLETASERCKQLEDEVEEAKAEAQKAAESADLANGSLEQATSEQKVKEEVLDEHRKKCDDLSQELAVAQQTLADKEAQLANAQDSFKSELDTAKALSAKLQEKLDQANAEVDQNKVRLAESETQLTENKNVLAENKSKLDDVKKVNDNVTGDLASLALQLNQAQEELINTTRALADAVEARETANGKLNDIQQELAQVKETALLHDNDLAKTKEDKDAANRELVQQKDKLERMEAAFCDTKAMLADAAEAKEKADNQLAAQKQMVEDLKEELSGNQFLLKKLEKDKKDLSDQVVAHQNDFESLEQKLTETQEELLAAEVGKHFVEPSKPSAEDGKKVLEEEKALLERQLLLAEKEREVACEDLRDSQEVAAGYKETISQVKEDHAMAVQQLREAESALRGKDVAVARAQVSAHSLGQELHGISATIPEEEVFTRKQVASLQSGLGTVLAHLELALPGESLSSEGGAESVEGRGSGLIEGVEPLLTEGEVDQTQPITEEPLHPRFLEPQQTSLIEEDMKERGQGDRMRGQSDQTVMTDYSETESLADLGRQIQHNIAEVKRIDSELLGPPLERLLETDDTDDLNTSRERSNKLQRLLEKVRNEGVHILSLSELQFIKAQQESRRKLRGVAPSADLERLVGAWHQEKEGLQQANQALKDLLAQADVTRASSLDIHGSVSDWRAQLLKAVHQVFTREREVLLAELRSFVAASGIDDTQSEVTQLELKIAKQASHQNSSFAEIMSADRQSLLAEVNDLRAHVNLQRTESGRAEEEFKVELGHLQEGHEDNIKELQREAEENAAAKERSYRKELDLMSFKLSQEQTMSADLRASLQADQERLQLLSQQLASERARLHHVELQSTTLQEELNKLSDQREASDNKLSTLKKYYEEEKVKTSKLGELLEEQQRLRQDLEKQLDDDRGHSEARADQMDSTIEKYKLELQSEKENHQATIRLSGEERHQVEKLRHELELSQADYHRLENKLSGECARLTKALEEERIQTAQLTMSLNHGKAMLEKAEEHLESEKHKATMSNAEKSLMLELQGQLEIQRSRCLDLTAALEREKYKVSSITNELESEKVRAFDSIEREKINVRQLKSTLEAVQHQVDELRREVAVEGQRASQLQASLDQLQLDNTRLKHDLREKEANGQRTHLLQQQSHASALQEQKQRKYEVELENQRLKAQLSDANMKVTELQMMSSPPSKDLTTPINSPSRRPYSRGSPHHSYDGDGNMDGRRSWASSPHPFSKDDNNQYRRQLEGIRQKLQLAAVQLQTAAPSLSNQSQPLVEMDTVLAELRLLQSVLSPMSNPSEVDVLSGYLLTADGIMRNNSELTGLIAKLIKEKSDLCGEISRLQQAQLHSATTELTSRKEADWMKEKKDLVAALRKAEDNAGRLQRDLAHLQRDMASSNSTPTMNGTASGQPTTDKRKLEKVYAKYIHSESWRKALIYQKQYLLLLLGGFQECENATLSMICKIGVYPDTSSSFERQRKSPRTRFRSAVRAVIAASRLNRLVVKYHRTIHAQFSFHKMPHRVALMLTSPNSMQAQVADIPSKMTPSPRVWTARPPSSVSSSVLTMSTVRETSPQFHSHSPYNRPSSNYAGSSLNDSFDASTSRLDRASAEGSLSRTPQASPRNYGAEDNSGYSLKTLENLHQRIGNINKGLY